jgi:peptide/nickel transport system permease protein
MLGYVVRRLLVALVLVWLLSVITFVMYFKIPADPAGVLVDMQKATPDQIAKAHHALGVDRPVYVQYGKYVWRAVHGDFGFSWATAGFFGGQVDGVPVAPLIVDASRVTGSLVLGGIGLLLLIAIPLGTFVATRPRSWVDRATIGFSVAAISTHPLVVGLLLQLFVGNRWHIAPPSGYCPFHGRVIDPANSTTFLGSVENLPTCGGPVDWASHLVLPWLTFALFFVALYLRMVRTRMLEVLSEPYVRTARAKGASELRVVRAHALRNGISPIVTMIGMDAGMAIGIAMYIETVFGLPGLGRTTISALNNASGFDLPVIVGITLAAGLAIILLNLVVDLALLAIDPTISRRRVRANLRAAHGPAA